MVLTGTPEESRWSWRSHQRASWASPIGRCISRATFPTRSCPSTSAARACWSIRPGANRWFTTGGGARHGRACRCGRYRPVAKWAATPRYYARRSASLADSIAALLDDPHALADLAGGLRARQAVHVAANAATVRESLATATSQAWSAALHVGRRRRRANEDARLGARSDAGRGAEPARVPGQPGVGRRDLCGRLVQSGSHARDRAGRGAHVVQHAFKTTAAKNWALDTLPFPTSGYSSWMPTSA